MELPFVFNYHLPNDTKQFCIYSGRRRCSHLTRDMVTGQLLIYQRILTSIYSSIQLSNSIYISINLSIYLSIYLSIIYVRLNSGSYFPEPEEVKPNGPFNPAPSSEYIYGYTHSFIHSILHSFILSSFHSFIHSFIHSFMHASIHPFIHSHNTQSIIN